MGVKPIPYTLKDFSLGVNDKDDPKLIPINALADAENAEIGVGYVSKRNGYSKYTPVALGNPINYIYQFFKTDGTNELLAVSNKTVYKDTAGTLNSIPFNTILNLDSNDVKMITYKNRTVNDVVLIADSGTLKVYDGTEVKEVTPHIPTTGAGNEEETIGLNGLASLTDIRAMTIKRDRFFVAGSQVKNRLSFCHHDPTLGYAVFDYFPEAYFFDLAPEDNDSIVALKTFRDSIIAFMERSIWVIRGDGSTLQDYTLHRINTPSGCISPKSVTEVGNYLFYVGEDNIYSLFATDRNYISAEPITTNKETKSSIEKTFKALSLSDKKQAVGTFHDNKYYLSFPSGLTLVYNLELGIWYKWTNVQANSFLIKDGELYFSGNGLIYKFDSSSYNDDGQAITFKMKTKYINFDSDDKFKRLTRMMIHAKQYDVLSSSYKLILQIDDISHTLKDEEGNEYISTDLSMVLGEGVLGKTILGWRNIVEKELIFRDVNYKGLNYQLEVINDKLDEPITIYSFIFKVKYKKYISK